MLDCEFGIDLSHFVLLQHVYFCALLLHHHRYVIAGLVGNGDV